MRSAAPSERTEGAREVLLDILRDVSAEDYSALTRALGFGDSLQARVTLVDALLSHQAAPPRDDDGLVEHRVLITDAILCRVFEPSDYDRLREEWAAFDKTRWLHWSRAFGAFLNGALIARGRGVPLPAPEDAGRRDTLGLRRVISAAAVAVAANNISSAKAGQLIAEFMGGADDAGAFMAKHDLWTVLDDEWEEEEAHTQLADPTHPGQLAAWFAARLRCVFPFNAEMDDGHYFDGLGERLAAAAHRVYTAPAREPGASVRDLGTIEFNDGMDEDVARPTEPGEGANDA